MWLEPKLSKEIRVQKHATFGRISSSVFQPLRSRNKIHQSDITDLMDSLMHAFRYFSSFRICDVIGRFWPGGYLFISSNSFCCMSGFFAKWKRSAAVEYAVCTESVGFVKM